MYAKLINGILQPSPNPIYIDPWWIGNPTTEMLISEGYKPAVYTTPPVAAEGFVAVPGWTETEDEIVQTWKIELEPDEISADRAFEILFGEEEP